MGIGENMIYNKLQFDDIDSKDYGVYITGSAAFNSPNRDVEMVTVPGRNGELVLDNGRYNNIEVTYPAGTFGSNETDFRTKMRNIRNALASKKGYQRLEDSYNPDEYRMATFIDAIEAEPVGHNIAAEFDLVFNCKPQRFLTSGETPVLVTSGDTITNPTLFESQPLIEVENYGTLVVNGHEIEIASSLIGHVVLFDDGQKNEVSFDENILNPGDTIAIERVSLTSGIMRNNLPAGVYVQNITTQTPPATASYSIYPLFDFSTMTLTFNNLSFTAGTPSTVTDSWKILLELSDSTSGVVTINASVDYDGDGTFTFSLNYTGSGFEDYLASSMPNIKGITANSTVSTIGHPMYIDCEIGEVYKIENGSYIPLNSYVDLGSQLPVLSPGSNEITYDNTLTNVKIIPRWWLL